MFLRAQVYSLGKLKRLSATVGIVLSGMAYGQNARFDGVSTVGGPGNDYGNGIASDFDGNLYLTGQFEETVDFDPGLATALMASQGSDDAFIQKLDANGNFLCVRSLGGASYDAGTAIAVDDAGNSYTIGSFQETIDLDPGPGDSMAIAAGSRDIFVVKLDADGSFVWGGAMGSTSMDVGADIAISGDGFIYTSGRYDGSMDFDFGPGVQVQGAPGAMELFVQKLDQNGQLIWARTAEGTQNVYGYEVEVDAVGNVYAAGIFSGIADFDPGPGTVYRTCTGTLNLVGEYDIFILKWSSAGEYVWVRQLGSAGANQLYDLTVDPSGDVVTAGSFTGTVDFDPSSGISRLTAPWSDSSESFLHKFGTDGQFKWVRGFFGALMSGESCLTTDASSNIYLGGGFHGVLDADPGDAYFPLVSESRYYSSDLFLSKLDSSGALIAAFETGGNENDAIRDLVVDGSGGVQAVGIYSDEADLDLGPTVEAQPSVGGTDIFAGRISFLDTPPHVLSIVPSLSGPTRLPGIEFTVRFSEYVENFESAADLVFRQASLNFSDAVISGGPMAFTVALADVAGDGSLELGINLESDTVDRAGNPLAATVFSAPVVFDQSPPILTVEAPSTSLTNGGPVHYALHYTGADTVALTVEKIALVATGTASGELFVTDGTTSAPVVTVDNITGDGTLSISIAAATASDTAGNVATPSPSSDAFVVDNTSPLPIIESPSPLLTNTGPVEFVVTAQDAVPFVLTEEDVALVATGTATGNLTFAEGPGNSSGLI